MKANQVTIKQALKEGSDFLDSDFPNPQNEALILLQYAAHRTKEYLLAHSEKNLSPENLKRFQSFLDRRDKGEPLAYITEEKEFWSLPFYVTQGVLIPRPESEQLVESTLEIVKNKSDAKILDLGTGCGCIALSIAKEKPSSQIVACDISDTCINTAWINANNLGIQNVSFIRSHWFSAIEGQDFDIIVCNPPYIAEDDKNIEVNVEKFEPDIALFSGKNGLDDLYHIIREAPGYLTDSGSLILEHGWEQSENVQIEMQKNNFHDISTLKDIQNHDRVTTGIQLKQ